MLEILQKMVGNGDVYSSSNEKVIDGEIAKDTSTEQQIKTTLALSNVNAAIGGQYQCLIKWGTLYIKSEVATLTVNSITTPPRTANVASGGRSNYRVD